MEIQVVKKAVAALSLVAALLGCGGGTPKDQPELALVVGTVTQGGQPLPGALVIFEPVSGAASTGLTDETGRFELQYLDGVMGAIPGAHVVRVSKMEGEAGNELIPPKYNSESSLLQMVDASGKNDFTIEL